MPPFFVRHALKIALVAVAVILALVIGVETNWGAGRAPAIASGGPRPSLAEARLLPSVPQVPAEQAYPETGARPLFTPARRPAPAGIAAGTMVKGQYTLHGVTIIDGLAIAMLKDKSSGKTMRVEKGKEYNGVTIGAIESDRVTLVQGEESEVVALLVQKVAPAATAFIPAGPFGAAQAAPQGSAVTPVAERPANAPQMSGGAPGQPGGAVPGSSAMTGSSAPATPETPEARLRNAATAASARRAQRFQEQQDAAKQNAKK